LLKKLLTKRYNWPKIQAVIVQKQHVKQKMFQVLVETFDSLTVGDNT